MLAPSVLLDAEGRIVDANPAFLALWRIGAVSEVLGRPLEALCADAPAARRALQRLWAQASVTGDVTARCADGTAIALRMEGAVVPRAGGKPAAAVAQFSERPAGAGELQRVAALLDAVADHFPDGYVSVIESDYRIGFTAGMAFARRGLDPARYIGRTVPEVLAPHGSLVQQTVMDAYQRTFAGSPQTFELLLAGEQQHYETVPLRAPDGTVTRILSVVRDVTAERRIERVLHARLRQQSAIAILGQFALESASLDEVTQRACELVAETLDVELVKVLELLPDRTMFRLRAGVGWHAGAVGHELVPASRDSQAGYTLTSRQPIIVHELRTDPRFSGPALLEEHGVISGLSVLIGTMTHPVGVLGAHTRTHRDFTDDDVHMLQAVANIVAASVERAAVDAALRRSEARFRSLVENASDMITVVDGQGVIQFQSPSVRRLLGYAPDELLQRSAFELIHPEDVGQVRSALQDAMRHSGGAVTAEYRLRHHDGGWRTLESRGVSTAEQTIVVTSRDVTERRAAEEALRESERLFARQARLLDEVQAAARIGGWELDLVTRELYWTDETYRIHETSPAEYTPTVETAIAFYAPESRPIIAAAVEEAERSGRGWDLELELVTARNRRIWVRAVGQVQMENGRPVRAFGGFQDITARRVLEDQFRQAQKLEAIGQLSGGVAHDFNNLLTVIKGHASLLDVTAADTPDVQDSIQEIRRATDRAADLTRQLLAFSRRQVLRPENVDLNVIVEKTTRMLQRIVGEDIVLRLRFADHPLVVHADAGMLEQALLNLVVNARDAMPRGGRLAIETGVATFHDASSPPSPHTRPGTYAWLSVTDTGEGIPSELLDRIFEPFFTTKDVGRGTGLGLATVHGIAQQHDGWVQVDSAVDRGSTFRFYLPLTDAEVAVDAAAGETAVRGGAETVLLVEDEPALRALSARILSELGYRVLEARSGVEALAVWDQQGPEIDIVLTDVVMPEGVGGLDLARRLQQERPTLKVLCTSGYSAMVLASDVADMPRFAFLAKPFDPHALARAVRACLDEP